MDNFVRTSYKKRDVQVIIRDGGKDTVELKDAKYLQYLEKGGKPYNVLPYEKLPSHSMNLFYYVAMDKYARSTAALVATLAMKVYEKYGNELTLVSIGNSATPVGILLKRYYEFKYGVEVKHYNISFIRNIGLDMTALEYIRRRHLDKTILFIDGWTGKGLISDQLACQLENYPNINSELAVLVDLAGHTTLCATHKDYIIPSACMNSVITGLVSKTFIDAKDPKNSMHRAIYYYRYESIDNTYGLIDGISKYFRELEDSELFEDTPVISDQDLLRRLCKKYDKESLDNIRPGICESIRGLIKPTPDVLLVNSFIDDDAKYLINVAREKGIPVIKEDLGNYKCCVLTK